MTLETLRIYWAKYRNRSGRGNALTGELKGLFLILSQGGVLLLVIERFFGILLPLWVLPVFWIIQKIVEYYLAKFDQKVLKFWQAENDFASRQTNPFNDELLSRIKNIENKLNG